MNAVRVILLMVLVFTAVSLASTRHQTTVLPDDYPPVLVTCADGPVCAVPPGSNTIRTITVHWVHAAPGR